MKIRVDEIKDKVVDLSTSEDVAAFPVLSELQASRECGFLGPLRIQLAVAREYDHIRAHGHVATTVRLGCSRCLAELDLPIDVPFTLFYMPAVPGVEQDEEVELTEEDLVSVTYEGDEIVFDHEIAEQVLAEIPFKPLCREDCKGLCPTCGVDLNESACGCSDQQFSSKFGELKNFKPGR